MPPPEPEPAPQSHPPTLDYIRYNEYIKRMLDPNLFFEACADETRRRVLMLLQSQRELCVCDLLSALDLPQPKVSRHLAVLREFELVYTRKQGTWVYYRLHPELPLWAVEVLRAMADGTARTEPYTSDRSRIKNFMSKLMDCCA